MTYHSELCGGLNEVTPASTMPSPQQKLALFPLTWGGPGSPGEGQDQGQQPFFSIKAKVFLDARSMLICVISHPFCAYSGDKQMTSAVSTVTPMYARNMYQGKKEQKKEGKEEERGEEE